MVIRLVLFSLIAFCATALAAPVELPIHKGEGLDHARSALMRAGWKPIETFTAMEDGELEHFHFGAGEIYRTGVKEVESCMGTGGNPCFYNYHRGDRCLFLITEGEYDHRDRSFPVVTDWYLYPVPSKKINASRTQYPFCAENAANKTRPHTTRPY